MSAGVPSFGARVLEAVRATGPLCVGIDPSRSLLEGWGLADDVEGLREFGLRCLDAFAGVVPVIKPQLAFFERHGPGGLEVLAALLAGARERGILAIADAKRGDIGSTSEAYAEAWLSPHSVLAADAVTAVAYMGLGALQPMLDMASANGRGVLVVVRSSNPEGRGIQEAVTADGDSVEDMLLTQISARNRAQGLPVGSCGVVVGATLEPTGFDLGTIGGIVLAPGVGAQGAGADDLARLFGRCTPGTVLPSASRSVLVNGPDVSRLREAAQRTVVEVAGAIVRPGAR